MSPQILSLIVFADNIRLNLNRPTKIAVCAPGFSLGFVRKYSIKPVLLYWTSRENSLKLVQLSSIKVLDLSEVALNQFGMTVFK
jgi:hypothetical protein